MNIAGSQGSAGEETIADEAARAQALDVARSFVVQAPAGSGKTGLLVQRFLALLARARRPESILAVTFTRKAAGEMRRRILEALRAGADGDVSPSNDFERRLDELARAVLARDAAEDWQLLRSPSRLQVFTIDGFCSRVVSATPLQSRLGSMPDVVDDARPLYREAVRRTLGPSGRSEIPRQVAVLLERYELGLERLEDQLVEMLGRREQWLGATIDGDAADAAEWVARVEAQFVAEIDAEVRFLAEDLDHGFFARIHDLACHSRTAVGAGAACAWPTLGSETFLGGGAESIAAWQQAAALLLTKDGKLRKMSFAEVYGSSDAVKREHRALLEDLAGLAAPDTSKWLRAMSGAAKLPSRAGFSASGRDAIASLLAVLRLANQNLWHVFLERRQVDHVGVAMQAVAALEPGETLEKLDAAIDHILVDEFQDTNVLQCSLLRGLIRGWQRGDGRTLFLVGDPMQSIYRFRKAEVGLFLQARSSPRFFDAVELDPLVLQVNFRSTRSVIGWVNFVFSMLFGASDDAARSLVAFAKADPKPGAEEGPQVEAFRWDAASPVAGIEADEIEAAGLADRIARELASLPAERRAGSAPVAVLVRARSHAIPLLRALERCEPQIRTRAPGLDRLRNRGVAIDLEALTRALLHPGDRLSHLAVLRSPAVGLTLADLSSLVEHDVAEAQRERREPQPIALLLEDPCALARVSDDGRERIARWAAILRRATHDLVSRPVDLVVRSAWLRLGGPPSNGAAARLESLDADAFFDLLAAHARGGFVDLDDFSRALSETDAAVDEDAEVDVEIMTMHKAKGLEFDTVVLPALGRPTGKPTSLPLAMETQPESGLLHLVAPRGAKGREDEDLDKFRFLEMREQRRSRNEIGRLLYVAATRARRLLILSASEGSLKMNGDARASSLLQTLEPALAPAAMLRCVAEAAEAAAPQAAQRFPLNFALAAGEHSIPDRSLRRVRPSELAEEAERRMADDGNVLRFAEGKLPIHVGSAYHLFVERIAAEGLELWTRAQIESRRGEVKHVLRSLGVLPSEIEAAADRVSRALVATTGDSKGRWLLAPHDEARSEWALTELAGGTFIDAKLDRTFVAAGHRWIVDFKTGTLASTAAIEARRLQYAEQLRSYRDLLRQQRRLGDLPIRLGLFFAEWPEQHRWQDITDLVERPPGEESCNPDAAPAS